MFERTVGLVGALRDFLRDRVTVTRAEEEIKRSLGRREEHFLDVARTQIYERPASPYLTLLRLAGCEFSDLRRHVRGHGLERTLEQLAREGVYLTADEFKGKREVARGGRSFRVSPRDLEPSDPWPGFVTQSSGTTNHPIPSFIPLDVLARRTLSTGVFFAAHELFSSRHAVYDAILPGAGGIYTLLTYARLGIATERWFAREIPIDRWRQGRGQYQRTYAIVLAGKIFGPGFPRPQFLDIGEVHRIVRWATARRRGGRCCIKTAASNAARIARVAWERGVSLEGTTFYVSGEPFTEAKREAIERVGASATCHYAFSPGVHVGHGCAHRLHTDDLHVNQHMLAVVSHPEPLAAEGPPIRPLLFTTLYPSAPRFLLNVANGDYAMVAQRDCGCALERVGLTLHLHHIRSYEKLTSEGMNYFTADLFELLERALPAEFGGGPGDYQLVEEEDDAGQTRLTLRVHPGVGAVSEAKVLARLQEGLAAGPWPNRFQTAIWRGAGTLRMRREVPHASARGKILPLHLPQ